MKIAIFDMHAFEKSTLEEMNQRFSNELVYFDSRLNSATASLAKGFEVICSFTNDHLDSECLKILSAEGVRLIALRSAGFNHVDLAEAARLNMKVVRVPAYSPYSVAEFATCVILALNRKICRSHSRVREMNFSLDGLVGFDLHGKTVGVIGTGRIGAVFCKIMSGFGCKVLAYDPKPNPDVTALPQASYVSLDELFTRADILSLHVPLNTQTRHLINKVSIAKMKKGIMLINTGRGALIDTVALIEGLKTGQIGAAGLDVYEEEESVFFQDLSGQILQDDHLARLLTFPNVMVSSHQAFLTREALHNIAETTFENIQEFELGKPLTNEVKL
jgi:D-lactate dehydrogenase